MRLREELGACRKNWRLWSKSRGVEVVEVCGRSGSSGTVVCFDRDGVGKLK